MRLGIAGRVRTLLPVFMIPVSVSRPRGGVNTLFDSPGPLGHGVLVQSEVESPQEWLEQEAGTGQPSEAGCARLLPGLAHQLQESLPHAMARGYQPILGFFPFRA